MRFIAKLVIPLPDRYCTPNLLSKNLKRFANVYVSNYLKIAKKLPQMIESIEFMIVYVFFTTVPLDLKISCLHAQESHVKWNKLVSLISYNHPYSFNYFLMQIR